MADIKELVKKRGTLKGRVTVFAGYLTGLPTEPLSPRQKIELELRVSRIEDVLPSFDEVQGEIEMLASEGDQVQVLQERTDFENSYFEAISKAKALLAQRTRVSRVSTSDGDDSTMTDKHSVIHNSTPLSQQHMPKLRCKLPIINLPKFSGSYENWLEFRDTFNSLIHKNDNIDNINKFHYLKSSLEGSASLVIQSLEISSDNYHHAWKLICDRYDNRRLLINNHVTAIFNINSINKESPASIRYIIDSFSKNLRALETLKEPIKHWDTLLIHLACNKLDSITRREWEEFVPSLKIVTFDNFINFLRNRADLLETITVQLNVTSPAQRPAAAGVQTRKVKERGFVVTDTQSDRSAKSKVTPVCPKCAGDHFLFECQQFLSLSNKERADELPRLNVCFNCLKGGHYIKNCWRSGCKICHKRHNSLVHFDKSYCKNVDKQTNSLVVTPDLNSNVVLMAQQDVGQVLLSTALVCIHNSDGTPITARAILDNGSTSCFITESLCQKLNLPTKTVNTSVTGVNNLHSKLTKICKAKLTSRTNNYNFETTCFVIPTITSTLPSYKVDLKSLNIPCDILLADPEFYLPSSVDLLLGANIFWDLLQSGRLKLGNNKPIMCQTKLGWLVSGFCPTDFHSNSDDVQCNFIMNDDHDSLTRFWQLDECTVRPETAYYSPEESACEEHFVKNTTRLPDGRFCVRLPLKQPETLLGDSYEKAEKCFLSLERRLSKDTAMKSMYTDFMSEYEQLGDMSEVIDPAKKKDGNFLPHHGVSRVHSLTTKLRVVFNGSSPTTSGISFNDLQMVGPTIQDDIVAILLRFRQYKYVFSADVEKMYRRVIVNVKDRHLQQILWRKNSYEPIRTYQLNTVTYGTASAPFLAIRCLKELAHQCKDSTLAEVIAKDFYVDDFLSGSTCREEACRIISGVTKCLQNAGMHLRKWRSNDSTLIKNTTNDVHDLNLDNLNDAKMLGLGWKSDMDELCLSINVSDVKPTPITKRLILSKISKVFDPLGLVAPCVVQCKILLQKLWLHKLSWDEEVPSNVLLQWNKIVNTLPTLNNLRIPRPAFVNHTYFEFHVFSDASEGAYGACLYVRSVNSNDNSIVTRLLMAKSRVSPVKPVTIPRLELCGALIAARLCKKALKSLRIQPQRCIFWTDSTIVLGWLRMLPSQLKVYVRNRVSDILEITGDSSWRHVPTKDNPADYVSRGFDADKISANELWWSGPDFLIKSEDLWPCNIYSKNKDLPEVKSETVMTNVIFNHEHFINFEQFSNFTKLIRVTAYLFRFLHNINPKCKIKLKDFLKTNELHNSTNYLIKISQIESFPSYHILKQKQRLHTKDSLLKLNPFIDIDGLMRVGGRLNNSEFDYDQKHPIILSASHTFTKLLFSYEHKRLLHAGPQTMLYSIRQKFWPIGGRNLSKSTYHNCVICTRLKGATTLPIMGDLPASRVHLEHPFQVVGVDYAGPILSASKKGRGCLLKKVYVGIFVCFATRAIHLELVSDLSADGYMAALHRFVSRRGLPSDVYSDNGTQFVGARNDLKRFLKLHSNELSERAANDNINFHFVPPYSPHFSGLAEAGVKSTKHHLKRVLSNSHLTFEELCTVLSQIEAILNSRPITPLSSDSNDLLPLTPGHFLIGRPLTAIPSPSYIDINVSRLTRYQRVQLLQQHFWTRWSKEYISELQERQKWRQCKGSLSKDMMVVIKDDNLPPLKWKLGRIVDIFPGHDGISRVADIRTSTGITRRAFSKICPLPVQFS